MADEINWVKDRAKDIAFGAAMLFAHLGLQAVDDVAAGYAGAEAFRDHKNDAAILPENESQIKLFLTRFSFMSRLQCIARSLPSLLSADSLRAVDSLAVATAAGCAGLPRASDLTAAQQGRVVLPTRFGGIIPGNGIVASASHVGAAASVETFLTRFGSSLSARGLEPWILARIRDRIQDRAPGANRGDLVLTPIEVALRDDAGYINAAHASADVRAVLHAEPPVGQPAAPLPPVQDMVDFSRLGDGRMATRPLNDILWAQEYYRLFQSGSPIERAKLLEGRLPGAGLAFAAVPSVAPFAVTGAGFMRMVQNAIGVTGHPLPHTHHCGRGCGVAMQLGESSRHHIQVCPNFGRATLAHDEVKNALVHMLVSCGITSEARTEVRIHGGGGQFDFDIVFFDRLTGRRVMLEVTRVAITQATVAGSGILASFDAALSILRTRERERCEEANVSAVVENDEGNTQFIPIVFTSCGGFGPRAHAFFKEVYKRAQKNGSWAMASGQPDVHTTWSTLYAS